MVQKIFVKIADIPITINCNNSKMLKWFKKKYFYFLISNKPRSSFKIEIKKRILYDSYGILKKTNNGEKISFDFVHNYENNKIYISINKKKRSATINTWNEKKNDIIKAIEIVIYNYILQLNKGCILHAASVIKNNKGYIFLGSSGTGKSTICKKARAKILHDDKSLIIWKKNKFKIFNSTIDCKIKSKKKVKSDISSNLHAIYVLRQAKKNKVVKKNPISTLHYLKCQSSQVGFWRMLRPMLHSLSKNSDGILKNLSSKVESYDLYFNKKCDFWQLIEKIK